MAKSIEYIILEETEPGTWTERGTHQSDGAQSAIREFFAGNTFDPGMTVVVAVPARHFNPMRLSTRTTTRLFVIPASEVAVPIAEPIASRRAPDED